MSQVPVSDGVDYLLIEDSNGTEVLDVLVVEIGTQGEKGEPGDAANIGELDARYVGYDSSGLVPTNKLRAGSTTTPGVFMYARGSDITPLNGGAITENNRVVTPLQVDVIAKRAASAVVSASETIETIIASSVNGSITLDGAANKRYVVYVDRAATINVVNMIPADPSVSRGMQFTLVRNAPFIGLIVINGIDLFLPKDQGQPAHSTKVGFGEMYNVTNQGTRVVATVLENVQLRYRAVQSGLLFNFPYTEGSDNLAGSLVSTDWTNYGGQTTTSGEVNEPAWIAGGGWQFDGADLSFVQGPAQQNVFTMQQFISFGSVGASGSTSPQRLFDFMRSDNTGHSNWHVIEQAGTIRVIYQNSGSTAATGYSFATLNTGIPVVANKEYSIACAIDATSLTMFVADLAAGTDVVTTHTITYVNGRVAGQRFAVGVKLNNGGPLVANTKLYGTLGYNRKLTIAEMRQNAKGYR